MWSKHPVCFRFLVPFRLWIASWKLTPHYISSNDTPRDRRGYDAGHSLRIFAYSDTLLGLAYTFPAPASPFGLSYEDDDGYIGTDQFPRARVGELIECFFTSDTKAMRSLLAQFPMSASN